MKNKFKLLGTVLLFSSAFLSNWINSGTSDAATLRTSTNTFNIWEEQTVILADKQNTLPIEVQSAVLEAASQQTSRTVAALKIVESQQKDWSDGCLGLTEPDTVCVQGMVSGWQVEVTDGLRNWTFRTDDSGDLVKLEEPVEQ